MRFLGLPFTLGSEATTEFVLVQNPQWVWTMDVRDRWVWVPRVRGDVWVEYGSNRSTDPYADTREG